MNVTTVKKLQSTDCNYLVMKISPYEKYHKGIVFYNLFITESSFLCILVSLSLLSSILIDVDTR